MTATKKKKQTKSSGGTLMGMRSGFQKVTGTGAANKKKKATGKAPWTFQRVFLYVAVAAVLLALFYALSHR